jgi:hypothetical protein
MSRRSSAPANEPDADESLDDDGLVERLPDLVSYVPMSPAPVDRAAFAVPASDQSLSASLARAEQRRVSLGLPSPL